ncbi:MAG: hypothetical protein QM731_14685 [Chitinophagaceae bacterium]
MKRTLYNSYHRVPFFLEGKYPVYNCLYKKCLLLVCIFIGCISCLSVSNAQTASARPSQKRKEPALLWTVAWSPDDKYVALGGDDSVLTVYETVHFTLYRSWKMNSMIRCVRWHPKGRFLAIGNNDNVQMLDMQSVRIMKPVLLNHGARGIGWNHTGDLLGVADLEGIVWILQKDGKILRSVKKENSNSYFSLDWHPARNILVTGGDEIRLFDTSGHSLQVIKHRKEETGVLSVAWHPGGDFFAIGDYGHDTVSSVLQFRHKNGTLLKELWGSKAEYRNIRWNKSGSLLASASDALRIWTKEGKLVSTGSNGKLLWGVDWNSKGTLLITTGNDGSIQVWTNKARLIKTIR